MWYITRPDITSHISLIKCLVAHSRPMYSENDLLYTLFAQLTYVNILYRIVSPITMVF